MSNSDHQLFEGPYLIDFQNLSGFLYEVAEGGLQGLRREKTGWDKVNHELTTKLPTHADALRVAPDLGTQLTTLNTRIGEVRALKVVFSKVFEVLKETEVVLEDEREGIVGLVVDSARKAAKRKDPGLMVVFEETIRYHGQIGKRAAQSRRKNEAAAEEAEANAEEAEAEAETDGEQEPTAQRAAPRKRTARIR